MGAGVPFAFQDNVEVARRFPDLHPAFDPQEALTEANRCLNCFDAPCAAACPTHIDVPRFIKKIGTQNLMGSALTILGGFARAAMTAFLRATREVRDHGTFTFADETLYMSEILDLFR